nr:phosphatase [uncultured Mediterraneibacter sp.]
MSGQYEADIHTHTIASGHGSCATITDMVKAAKARNLRMLGISDHGPATLGGGRISYFRNLKYAQRERLGIKMLYGAEANIISHGGHLDLGDDILKDLDYVIASMHQPTVKPGSVEENTEAYIRAMKNPYVSVIGHCDDANFPVDPFRLFAAAMENHVLLEINNSSLSPEGYRGDAKYTDLILLNLSAHFDYPVLFSSDSHGTSHVGDFTYASDAAALAKVPRSLILNYSAKSLLSFLSEK